MSPYLTWTLDPVMLHFGPIQLRYYGVLFVATIYTGFHVWRQQALKNGESKAFADRFLWWGVVAILGGSRLGHVFFYEHKTYLAHPGEIIKFWKGGLASHGATVGLVLVLWAYAHRHGRTWVRLGDYLAPAIALAAGGVRLGNFINAEIVGRVTQVPWGVRFIRYCRFENIPAAACLPRHPSQIYEFFAGLLTFGVLTWIERKDVRRAGSGLASGVFLALYFGLRVVLEFFKEFQDEQLRSDGFLRAWEQSFGHSFTTGQYLSFPLVIIGIALIVRALLQPKDRIPVPVATVPVK